MLPVTRVLSWKVVAILLLVLLFITESTRWVANSRSGIVVSDSAQAGHPAAQDHEQVLIRRQLLKGMPSSTTEVSLNALLEDVRRSENSNRSFKFSKNKVEDYEDTSGKD